METLTPKDAWEDTKYCIAHDKKRKRKEDKDTAATLWKNCVLPSITRAVSRGESNTTVFNLTAKDIRVLAKYGKKQGWGISARPDAIGTYLKVDWSPWWRRNLYYLLFISIYVAFSIALWY